MERKRGPCTQGSISIPTFEGKAGSRKVHWIAYGEERADELEKQFAEAGPLTKLLLLNTHTLEGLTTNQMVRAAAIIKKSRLKKEMCWRCRKKRALLETIFCRRCTMQALKNRR